MPFPKHLLLLALITFSAVAGSQAEIKVQSDQKVAFMGDSITQFGWDRPDGYVRLVAEALESAGVKIVVVPAGISGNTSRDMLGRIDGSVISQKPDWMTLSCGVNDVWHHDATHVDLEPYKANITSIVDKAQAAGIKVVILTATVIQENDNAENQALAPYNDFLRQLAKERNLPLADLNSMCWKSLEANPANRLTVDGVHMNPMGNMLMARGVLEAFGMAPAQIDTFEKKWSESPSATSLRAQISFDASAPVSMKEYNAMSVLAKEQNLSTDQFQANLLFDALRTVLKAHEQDPAFTPALARDELQKAFAQKIEEAAK